MEPTRNFCYIVDEKGQMNELEVIRGAVLDPDDKWLQYADSQVSTGWLSAAYRCLQDDKLDTTANEVVVVDNDQCGVIVGDDALGDDRTSSSAACIDSKVSSSESSDSSGLTSSSSKARVRSRSRTRGTSSSETSSLAM